MLTDELHYAMKAGKPLRLNYGRVQCTAKTRQKQSETHSSLCRIFSRRLSVHDEIAALGIREERKKGLLSARAWACEKFKRQQFTLCRTRIATAEREKLKLIYVALLLHLISNQSVIFHLSPYRPDPGSLRATNTSNFAYCLAISISPRSLWRS